MLPSATRFSDPLSTLETPTMGKVIQAVFGWHGRRAASPVNVLQGTIARASRNGSTVAPYLLLLLSACASDPTLGYSSASTFPAQYSTIAIDIFENESFSRDIEFELADALVKEVEARTPYKVTPGARADTLLTGRITRVELDQLSKSKLTGLGEEVVLAVTVDFTWTNARTGEVIEERQGFTGHALFLPSAPSGEPIELAEFGVVQGLARDIVGELRADW
jgi:hypothetical protein